MAGYVVRRLPQVRPAPESGVRLVAKKEERVRMLSLREQIEAEFRAFGKVFRDDDLVAVREGGGW